MVYLDGWQAHASVAVEDPACPDGFGQGALGGAVVAGLDGEGIMLADVDAEHSR